jgi:succinate dehydrogenase / fumarate reductase flavoprotein subunit/fumarate reductase flavoprotein subunit
VARASYLEIAAGRGTPQGGVWLDARPIGALVVAREFPGMVERMALIGRDLTREPIEVTPTAHFHMGGVRIDPACQTAMPGLLVAGEDAGGVHGANRLGGNGVAESTVFGAIAGETAAAYCLAHHPLPPFDRAQAEGAVRRAGRFLRPGQSPYPMRRHLNELMWEQGGLVRDALGLAEATRQLRALGGELESVGVPGGRAYNPGWQEALNLENLLTVAPLVIAAAAHREESRGSHYRRDFPQPDDRRWLRRVTVRQQAGEAVVSTTPVIFSRLPPEMAGLPA